MPDEVDLGLTMVDAAKAADVSRIVFSSVIHPTLSVLENHAAKASVEEAILASDIWMLQGLNISATSGESYNE